MTLCSGSYREASKFIVGTRPLLMPWTAPTRRHLGAKLVVFRNHRETGAVHEGSYHDRC